jgi:hypothetical protein
MRKPENSRGFAGPIIFGERSRGSVERRMNCLEDVNDTTGSLSGDSFVRPTCPYIAAGCVGPCLAFAATRLIPGLSRN